MACSFLSAVQVSGITQTDILHDPGQRHLTDLDCQMYVVGHQAKSVNTMSVFFHAFLEKKIKARPVGLGEKNVLSAVSPQDNVVNCAGIVNAWFSSHAFSVSAKSQNVKPDPIFSLILAAADGVIDWMYNKPAWK